MATNNFNYEHRCVVVTDDDYEMGNYPEYEKKHNVGDRNYPSYIICEFTFWDVVLTVGYYEAACIDYTEHVGKDIDDILLERIGEPSTQKELFDNLNKAFKLSHHKLREICGNMGDMDAQDYIDKALWEVGEYLAKLEEEKVNAYIDELKEQYCLDEYTCIGVAGNGEAFYEKKHHNWNYK